MTAVSESRDGLVPAALVPDGFVSRGGVGDVSSSLPVASPAPDARRCQVRFDGADDAYLVAAAIRRYLDASVVTDVILVPTDSGPALDVPVSALSRAPMRGLIARFHGRVAAAGAPE